MTAPLIETNPEICMGKPHLSGTRLTVEFIQGLVATGWSPENILDVYPYLKKAEVDAALKQTHPLKSK